MINYNTVLILGAGASAPYGFPCGRHLIDVICEDLNNLHSKFKLDLQKCGFEEKLIIDFRSKLYNSQLLSVDTFLEKKENLEYLKIGKAAISRALIPLEIPDRLNRNASEENWYEHLFSRLNTNIDKFRENKLSIVTFNYDRSLEFFLFTALKNSFNLGNEDAAKLLTEAVEIIHLHGQLGAFPFLGHKNQRYYYPEFKPEFVNLCASCIKLPNEESGEAPLFSRAHELIANANRVCFLGFGFHPDNTLRLINKVKNILQSNWDWRTFFGTAFKIGEAEKNQIKTMFRNAKIELGAHDEGILLFLSNKPILL